jgi:hypothetical protein
MLLVFHFLCVVTFFAIIDDRTPTICYGQHRFWQNRSMIWLTKFLQLLEKLKIDSELLKSMCPDTKKLVKIMIDLNIFTWENQLRVQKRS